MKLTFLITVGAKIENPDAMEKEVRARIRKTLAELKHEYFLDINIEEG